MAPQNKLILIGNGFDLAHGLKTGYRDFLEWYLCGTMNDFFSNRAFEDDLMHIKARFDSMTYSGMRRPRDFNEAIASLRETDYYNAKYKSTFFQGLVHSFSAGNWVDIECQYFHQLKTIFQNSSLSKQQRRAQAKLLNDQFNYLIRKLSEYFMDINSRVSAYNKLPMEKSGSGLSNVFKDTNEAAVTCLNFNYTNTLAELGYADARQIIHIHGSVANNTNGIIFGYGDESDPAYQQIEDSGDNVYLEHIKSFGYFQNNNYRSLMKLVDLAPFVTYVVGHSCGLSDRILLSEIFEHQNCSAIEIFYHQRQDGSDNFTEITQEMSRHFKPKNKGLMRKRIRPKDPKNFIPQAEC